MQNETLVENRTTSRTTARRGPLPPTQIPKRCCSFVNETTPAIAVRCKQPTAIAIAAQPDRFAVDPDSSELMTLRVGYLIFIGVMIGLNAMVWRAFLVKPWIGAAAFFVMAMAATVYGFKQMRD